MTTFSYRHINIDNLMMKKLLSTRQEILASLTRVQEAKRQGKKFVEKASGFMKKKGKQKLIATENMVDKPENEASRQGNNPNKPKP